MDDVYKNIDECNPERKRKILIVSDEVIANIMANYLILLQMYIIKE